MFQEIFKFIYPLNKIKNYSIENDYNFINSEPIGYGKTGKVYIIQPKFAICNKNKNIECKTVAAKKISLKYLYNKKRWNLINKEIKILSCLNHINIIHFIAVYKDKYNLTIVSEVATGGEVMKLLSKEENKKFYCEYEIKRIISQVLNALLYLHYKKKIIHLDIKPENILYSKNQVGSIIKLVDFGIANKMKRKNRFKCKKVKDKKLKKITGTWHYICPEIFKNELCRNNDKLDIWALGITTYVLFFSIFPFDSPFMSIIQDTVCEGRFSFPKHHKITESAKNFITIILNPNPKERPNVKELLNHPWIKNTNINDDKISIHSDLVEPFPLLQYQMLCRYVELREEHSRSIYNS